MTISQFFKNIIGDCKITINRLLGFLPEIPWNPLIVGASIGIPLFLVIQDLVDSNASPAKTRAWELALSVLLGGIVAWVIPEFVNNLRHAWTITHPLRSLLNPFHLNDQTTTIFIASLFPTNTTEFEKAVPLELSKTQKVIPHHGIPWVLTENDSYALGYVMAILAMAGKTDKLQIVRDDSININITDTNMICIGSSKSNLKTKQIISSFNKLPLKFELEGDSNSICKSDGSQKWCADAMYDYGLLMKIPNEYNNSKSIIIIGGISHVGTAGAGYYLLSS